MVTLEAITAVESEQKYLTQIFSKNQEILTLHGQIKQQSEDKDRLIESLKEQIEAQRKEIMEANEVLLAMQTELTFALKREKKALSKFVELGVSYAYNEN
jgi:thioredoxin-related protein